MGGATCHSGVGDNGHSCRVPRLDGWPSLVVVSSVVVIPGQYEGVVPVFYFSRRLSFLSARVWLWEPGS